eukprot:scaffold29905_cov64-Phaeocystis_antarctica.AAC.1
MLVGGARRRSSARHEGLGLHLAAARDHAVRALPTLPELPRLVLLLHLAAAARPQPVSDLRRPVDGDHAGDVERVVDRGAVQRGVRLGHRHVAGLVGLRGEQQRSHLILGRVAPHVPGQLGGLRRVVAGGRGGRARCAARDVRHAGQWHRSNGRGSGETRGEWPFKIRTARSFQLPSQGVRQRTGRRGASRYLNPDHTHYEQTVRNNKALHYMASTWLRHQSAPSASWACPAGAGCSAAARSKCMAASLSSAAERPPPSTQIVRRRPHNPRRQRLEPLVVPPLRLGHLVALLQLQHTEGQCRDLCPAIRARRVALLGLEEPLRGLHVVPRVAER